MQRRVVIDQEDAARLLATQAATRPPDQRLRDEHVRMHTANFKSVFEKMASWFKGNF